MLYYFFFLLYFFVVAAMFRLLQTICYLDYYLVLTILR